MRCANGKKMRLDQWLTDKKVFESREKSRREILAGRVREKHSGRVLDKPGAKVPKDLEIEILEKARFVGRAGEKLNAFLECSGMSPKGKVCLDVGSSTGGFTDCLLQQGAKKVFAVDVGTHQLHEKLREDSRVEVYEQTDIRNFDIEHLEPRPDWVLVDVSFISLTKILGPLVAALPAAEFILLFKPQFEVGRYQHGKHGIVADEVRLKCLEEMLLFLRELGLNPRMVTDSVLKGMKGNQESFIAASRSSFPKGIFRAYDIRGHAERELSNELFEKIGYVLGKKVCEKFPDTKPSIGIGRDSRPSSNRLFNALTQGLARHGVELVDVGEVTTPMLYFSKYHLKLQAAFQITASHNPCEDNGIKMMLGNDTLFGDEIRGIGAEAELVKLPVLTAKPVLIDKSQELESAYLGFLDKEFSSQKKWKIVVDCGNGMAGKLARKALSKSASDLQILYEEVDCSFPNHPADPTVEENLTDLILQVQKSKADVGFAFDGDGDRLGVVCKSGRILWGDEILMLLAESVLRKSPGAAIIGEVKCSEKLFRRIKELGGEPVMYRTGHSLIKKKMKEMGAPIAGEMSGHLFFSDRYFGFDDAMYGALRVLEAMEGLSMGLDEWISQFPAAHITPEMRVECAEEEKEARVAQVRDFFSKQSGLNLNLIDGVRVGFEDGAWALVRASNTQAVLVVRIEAPSDARIKDIKRQLEAALGKSF